MTIAARAPASIPGPVDRVHFEDEQRRYRRKSWRFSVFAAFAAITTGIPACVVVTPIVYAFALLVAYIVNAITPLSPATWASLQKLSEAIPRAVEAIDPDSGQRDIVRAAIGIAVLVVPGAIATLATWLAVRGLVGHVGVGWSLDRIGARPLRTHDQEERQLGNLVEEIAVAAGVKPPRVLLIDTTETNAAITGLNVDDSTILVTRGLLDTLDRDETQAVIAHLVGSVGNGDLRIASIIFSIYQTWGALALALSAPVERRARKAVWRTVKVAFRSRRREVDRWEEEFVSDALLRGAINENTDPNDLSERVMSSGSGGGHNEPNIFQKAYVMANLPLMLGAQVVRFAIFISSVVFVGPIVSFMWRTRRHLADAMAVQLTRYPDGLVRALHKLSISRQAVVKGAGSLGFLFIVWPSTMSSDDAVIGQFARMHPKLDKRQRRLAALGATNVSTAKTWQFKPGKTLGILILSLLIGPLSAVALGLSIVLLGMLTMLTLMMMMVLMFAVWAGLKLVFIVIPAWIAKR